MAYIIFVLGVMLAGSGGYALYSGFDDLTTERGLALTLSGTVGVSIGFVVIAISFGLWYLSRISRKLDDLKAATNAVALEIGQAMTLPKETESQVLSAIEDAVFAEPPPPAADMAPMRDRSLSRDASKSDPMVETVLGLEDGFGRRPPREVPERPVVPTATVEPKPDSATPKLGGLSSLSRINTGVAAAGAATAAVAAAATLAEGERAQPVNAPAKNGAAEAPASERNLMEAQADINRLIEELAIGDMAASAHPDTVKPDFAKADGVESKPEPAANFDATLLEELGKPTPASTPEHPILELSSENEAAEPVVEDAPVVAPPHAVAENENEVIGSYESAGVTYTLYADGSVIAESGQIRESYPSLEALRTAFERGESVFSV